MACKGVGAVFYGKGSTRIGGNGAPGFIHRVRGMEARWRFAKVPREMGHAMEWMKDLLAALRGRRIRRFLAVLASVAMLGGVAGMPSIALADDMAAAGDEISVEQSVKHLDDAYLEQKPADLQTDDGKAAERSHAGRLTMEESVASVENAGAIKDDVNRVVGERRLSDASRTDALRSGAEQSTADVEASGASAAEGGSAAAGGMKTTGMAIGGADAHDTVAGNVGTDDVASDTADADGMDGDGTEGDSVDVGGADGDDAEDGSAEVGSAESDGAESGGAEGGGMESGSTEGDAADVGSAEGNSADIGSGANGAEDDGAGVPGAVNSDADASGAQGDADADTDAGEGESVMRQRFTYNRKTVMRASSNATVSAPEHAKRIVYNKNGKYTLNLDVVGKSTRETHETTTKLDIVLVLDTSGSMDFCMDGDQWNPCSTSNPRRMEALKTAVNSFIDATASVNATIADDSDKVQVAIARFGQNSGVVQNLTSDAGSLKSSVAGLRAVGATPADEGMKAAQKAMERSRQDAKKVIIFFTDGVPTDYQDFNENVANRAIASAKSMKTTGTLVYSIGIFNGANPEQTWFGNNTTDKANQFMHAVSSNYPNATAYDRGNWGTGGNLGYYKATNSADDLKKIFDDIQQEITTGSAYSAVSITDELSEYAKADGIMASDDEAKTVDGRTYGRVIDGVSLNVTNLPAGASPPVEGRDYTMWYSEGDGGDAAGGNDIVRIEFAADYELADGAKYTLSYGVVPSDAAYARAVTGDGEDDAIGGGSGGNTDVTGSGSDGSDGGAGNDDSGSKDAGGIAYDSTGDPDTGVTSAGKPGFRSNAKAQVCYTFDNQSGCADYPHPVLQVPSANVTVTKHWEGGAPDGQTALHITLAQGETAKYEGDLTAANGWKRTFVGVLPGTYTVTESDVDGYGVAEIKVDGKTVHDAAAPVGLEISKTEMWNAFDAHEASGATSGPSLERTVEFTNKRDTVTLSEAMKVSKTVQGADYAGAFEFELTDVTDDAQKRANSGAVVKGMTGGRQTVSIGELTKGKTKEATFAKDSNGDPLTFSVPLDGVTDTYIFAVKEIRPQERLGWKFDRSEYRATVTVKKAGGEYKADIVRIVQVKDENGHGVEVDVPTASPMAFTNRYQVVSVLPLSGATSGRTRLAVVGAVVAVLLAAGIVGFAIAGRRKP